MIDFSDYNHGDGAPLALAADLASRLAEAEATAVHSGDGVHITRDGTVVNWTTWLPRPTRRSGRVGLADPTSFAEYVNRFVSPETVIYADKAAGRFTAVFNDHPASPTAIASASQASAGWRDHRAALTLVQTQDWTEWTSRDGRLHTQQEFGEFIDSMARTIRVPDAATMLEVATTLTAKQTIDYGSRTRLDNGDVAFKFESDTAMKAGRGPTQIEIPSEFEFEAKVWEGTAPVRVVARLRIRADRDAVRLGYKLIDVSDAVAAAFEGVRVDIAEIIGDEFPIFLGEPG